MKTNFKKGISLMLALCILITSLSGVLSIGTHAISTDPNTIHFNISDTNDWSAVKYLTSWSTFDAGDYKATVNFRLYSGDMPKIDIGNEYEIKSISQMTNYSKNYDSKNYTYTISFTLTSSWSGNLGWYIGNCGHVSNFSVAKPELYKLDLSGNKTGNNLCVDFCSDNYVTSRTGDKWLKANCYSNLVSFYDYDESEFVINPDTIHFNIDDSDDWSAVKYLTSDTIFSAGNYKATVNFRLYSGDMPKIDIGDSYNVKSISQMTNYSKNYDSKNCTYTISFTLTSSWSGNLGWYIGNYGQVTNFIVAKPELYKLDSSGNKSGDNLCADFRSDNYVTETTGDKWLKANCYSNLVTFYDYDESEFVINPDTIHFNIDDSDDWSAVKYLTSNTIFSAGNYKATVNFRLYSGDMPKIDIGNEYEIKSISQMTNYSKNYDSKNYTYTISFTLTSSWSGNLGWYIGNYGQVTNFIVAKPELYKLDSSGNKSGDNLCADFRSDNYVTSRTGDKWLKANCHSKLVSFYDYDESEFYSSPNKMLYVKELKTAYYLITYTQAKAIPGETYKIEYDWRAFDGAASRVEIKYYNGSSWSNITSNAVANSDYSVDGVKGFSPITEGNTDGYITVAEIGSSLGHYSVNITVPSDASKTNYNLQIGIAGYIKDNDVTHYGRGELFFSNFSAKKIGTDENIITYSAFNQAKAVSRSAKPNGWMIEVPADRYTTLKLLETPKDFFTVKGPSSKQVLTFNGGSWDSILSPLVLESDTTYRVSYKISFLNGEAYTNVTQYLQEDSGGSATTKSDVKYDDSTGLTTYNITTGTLKKAVKANAYLKFGVQREHDDVSFNISSVEVRKMVDGEVVGPNLVSNGGFYFGSSKTILNSIDNKSSDSEYFKEDELIGWQPEGSYASNKSIKITDYTKYSFPVTQDYSTRLTNLIRVLLGKKIESPANPYEDMNDDRIVDILDLVETKLSCANAAAYDSVDEKAQEFKNYYVNGNNATDLTKLSNSNMLATSHSGTTYYVDAVSGSDSNSGKSPSSAWKTISYVNTFSFKSGDAVLFKCGQTWRRANSRETALTCQNNVTYGSYGSGAKPIINGSVYNYANNTWSNQGGNIWRTQTAKNVKEVHSCEDVGIVVFDGFIGNMKATKAELSKEGDFWNSDVMGGTEGGDGYVYVYCTSNPSSKYSDIEIGQKMSVVELKTGVTANNIAVMYGGEHGMNAGGKSNIAISNCQVSYIGGSHCTTSGKYARFGNGIQFGQGGSYLRVKNCYVTDVFDSAITFQSWTTKVYDWEKVNFSNNLIERCFMGLEFFAQEDSKLNVIYLTNNIIRDTGGWSYDERLGDKDVMGTWLCASIKCGQDDYYENASEFYIYDNILDRSKGALVMWWFNAAGVSDAERRTQPRLYVYNNSYYQCENDGNRLMNFSDQNGVSGVGTGRLRTAVLTFDSSPNEVKYIYNSNRVIER